MGSGEHGWAGPTGKVNSWELLSAEGPALDSAAWVTEPEQLQDSHDCGGTPSPSSVRWR